MPEVVTDLSDPVMFSDPFPRYAELRRTAPVSTVRSKQLLRGDGYMLTRYDDVMQVHTDPRLSSDVLKYGRGGRAIRYAPRMVRLLTDSMVFKDDPEHHRLRSLVNRAFTPKLVQSMADDIDAVVSKHLDRIAARGTVDLVEEYAVQIPLEVIARMMGVGGTDAEQFHQWMKKFAESTTTEMIPQRMPNIVRKLRSLLARRFAIVWMNASFMGVRPGCLCVASALRRKSSR